MPFDTADPLWATVTLIDAMLEFYGSNGERWTRYRRNRDGKHCLTGAMQVVRRQHGIRGDQIRLALRTVERRATGRIFGLEYFNDVQTGYEAIRTILLAAREITMAKIEGRTERPVDITAVKRRTPQEPCRGLGEVLASVGYGF